MDQGRVGSPLGEEGGPGRPGQLGGGSEPPDGGLTLFPTSTWQMPAISSLPVPPKWPAGVPV